MTLPFCVSIIIPALNEEYTLPRTLARLEPGADTQIIVVDGGSQDNTVEAATKAGVTVLQGSGGRGGQLRLGAEEAKGSFVWLLHADTLVPKNWRTLLAPAYDLACFRLRIASNDPRFRLIEAGVRLRFWRDRIPYGDQSMWIRRSILEEVGGIPDQPLFEDVQLASNLQKSGYSFIQLPARIHTSARRWEDEGIWHRNWQNMRLRRAWNRGVPIEELVQKYTPHPSTK